MRQQVRVMNALGFHTRAVSQIIECASRFKCHITISYQGKQANAKHIFEVLTLGCCTHELITIDTEGADEQDAMQALTHLIQSAFGEGVVDYPAD